jgi:hypothetical protein
VKVGILGGIRTPGLLARSAKRRARKCLRLTGASASIPTKPPSVRDCPRRPDQFRQCPRGSDRDTGSLAANRVVWPMSALAE